jgi:hypothetical protein
MPFTAEQFFSVFAEYNADVWPMQIVLLGLAVVAVVLVAGRNRLSKRVVPAILALLWIWMGVAYHLMHFARINEAARIFGWLFIVQGAVFLWAGTAAGGIAFGPTPRGRRALGWLLLAYGLFIYPIIGRLIGHEYMASPTFGVPCPTTIFTVALLFFATRFPKYVLAIPIIWAAVGTSAALNLGVPQDFGLTVAGIASFALLFLRQEERRAMPTPPSSRA